MDAVKAFIQFLVDLFSALSSFLTGDSGTFDISGMLSGITGSEESSSATA